MTKVCTLCNQDLPLDSFSRTKRNKQGRVSWCKSCKSAYDKSRSFEKSTESKVCTGCGVLKTPDDFYHSRVISTGLSSECKDCHYWKTAQRKYGLSKMEHQDMLNRQNSCCPSCGDFLDKAVIDHCHETGEVRVLLCPSCNLLEGVLKTKRPDLWEMFWLSIDMISDGDDE